MISPRALNESLDRVLLLSTPLKPEANERSPSNSLKHKQLATWSTVLSCVIMMNSMNRDVGYTLYKTLNIIVNVNTLTLMSSPPGHEQGRQDNKCRFSTILALIFFQNRSKFKNVRNFNSVVCNETGNCAMNKVNITVCSLMIPVIFQFCRVKFTF